MENVIVYRYNVFFSNFRQQIVIVETSLGEDEAYAKAFAKLTPKERDMFVAMTLVSFGYKGSLYQC